MTMDSLDDGTTAELRALSGPLARSEDEPSGFTVMSLTGEEAVSELFSFDVVALVSPDHLARAEEEGGIERALLMQDVAFRVGPAGNLRFGMINEVDLEGPFLFDERIFARVRLRLVPRAWLLTQRRNSRIFQHKYVNEIVSAVLHESGVRHRWDLRNVYPRRVYCTQYEETDYDFVRRLFAEEGILFYFELRDTFGGGSRAKVREQKGELDEAVDGLRKAGKIIESAAKEATNIAKKTGNEAEEGGFGAVGAAAGLAGDLLSEDRDEEDTAPRQLGSGESGPSGSGEVLVFVDDPNAYGWSSADDGGRLELTLRDQAGLSGDSSQIDRLAGGWKTRPEHVEARDYDFRRPLLELKARVGEPLEHVRQPGLPLEIYDHHGEYLTEDVGAEGVTLQREQARRDAALAHGRGRSARIVAGHRFSLTTLVEHGRGVTPPEGDYAITRVHHQYDNPDFAAGGEGRVEGVVRGCARAIREALVSGRDLPETELRHIIRGMDGAESTPRIYQNRFECIVADRAFRPPRPPRLTRHVTETATVMGPPGQDIYQDRFGRVKVQFHWDREGEFDETSSCWLRVAQPWAGAGYGFQFFPRIGMEVLVTFLGGDTDRPVVVGALYNGTHATPEALPERKTRSGIRTQTSPKGGGFNELSFEDAREMERVYIHAQRNLEEVVQHDHDTTVGNRQSASVGGDQRTGVGGDQLTNVGKNRSTAVGGNESSFVAGSKNSRVVTSQTELVEQNKTTTVGGLQVSRVNLHDMKVVRGKLSVTAKSGAALLVAGGLEQDTCATAYVQGSAYLTAKERILVRTQNDEDPAMIRFECGDSVIEMHPDRIVIAANNIALRAKNLVETTAKTTSSKADKSLMFAKRAIALQLEEQKAGLSLVPDGADLYAKETVLAYSDTAVIADGPQISILGDSVSFAHQQRSAPVGQHQRTGDTEASEEPANVTLRFTHRATDDSEPIANTRYRVVMGEFVYEGSTDGDGQLQFYAPTDLHTADVTLLVNESYPDLYPTSPLQYHLSLLSQSEFVEPDTQPGVVVRLSNLGYEPALTDWSVEGLDPATVEALTAFQLDHGIPETGEMDDRTKEKLREVYGS